MARTVWQTVNDEVRQDFLLRKKIIAKISKHFENRYFLSFYTTIWHNISIDESDLEMLRTLLGGTNKLSERRILLVLNSLGGVPLAAEKIIKLLSEYSDNDYWVIIPGSAKSAATMVCLGASKIILSPISELGPIDLQISRGEDLPTLPAYSIVNAYDKLMDLGINLREDQQIDPILQQLQSFNPADIEYFRKVNELSIDMAVKVLKNCMMKKISKKKIENIIAIFTDPEKSKLHGRPIYVSDIEDIDKDEYFNIQRINTTDDIWQTITEYHIRMTTHMRVTNAAKIIESEENSLIASL